MSVPFKIIKSDFCTYVRGAKDGSIPIRHQEVVSVFQTV